MSPLTELMFAPDLLTVEGAQYCHEVTVKGAHFCPRYQRRRACSMHRRSLARLGSLSLLLLLAQRLFMAANNAGVVAPPPSLSRLWT